MVTESYDPKVKEELDKNIRAIRKYGLLGDIDETYESVKKLPKNMQEVYKPKIDRAVERGVKKRVTEYVKKIENKYSNYTIREAKQLIGKIPDKIKRKMYNHQLDRSAEKNAERHLQRIIPWEGKGGIPTSKEDGYMWIKNLPNNKQAEYKTKFDKAVEKGKKNRPDFISRQIEREDKKYKREIEFDIPDKKNLEEKLAIELHQEYNKGLKFLETGDNENALLSFKKGVDLDQNLKGVWLNKGVALGNLGRLDEEIVCYKIALRIDKNYKKALDNKAAAEQLEQFTSDFWDKRTAHPPRGRRKKSMEHIEERDAARYEREHQKKKK